ncbi:hypothetical protein, partial [Nocardioides marmotae]|uniref:hypothetical protein n=1 Tax=Nocardioides marmotae TaxID=2663857 RepID=UPI0012B5C74C
MAITTPHWTVGDRLAAFRVLLPADPGPTVVLAVGEVLGPHLRAAFPGALDLEEALAAGVRASLLVVETEHEPYDAGRPPVPLAPGASVAVLGAGPGAGGDHVLYPSAHEPELLWRTGWPVAAGDPVAWARRRALDPQADEVVAEVTEQLGTPGRLVGVT